MAEPATSRRLVGRVAAVTGGTSGIGLGIVARLLDEGAAVWALARTHRPEVDDLGARFVGVDVTDADAMRAALARVAGQAGPIDVLVLNAGIAELDAADLHDIDLDEVEAQIRVNTMGVLHGLTAMPPFLSDGASVIITSTAATAWAFPGYMGYSLSKAPLAEMCRHAAMKLGSRGIRVNTVSPGTVLTPMQPADDPEARIASVATCLGRPALPDDIAGVYAFLASDDSRYVTATDIRADGGWLEGFTEDHARAVLEALDARTPANAAGQAH